MNDYSYSNALYGLADMFHLGAFTDTLENLKIISVNSGWHLFLTAKRAKQT
jgi:hypothetical protein